LYHVRDVRTGVPVWINESRQTRPNLPTSCPFCPGGLEAPEPYDVRWFVNRWPAMPDDRCEVVLFSPVHDASLGSLGPAAVRKVVDLWAERTAALGARADVAAVLAFENRGADAGATIPHPHGQIYAFDEVPPVQVAELANAECWLCPPPEDGRLVAAHGSWQAAVPAAPHYPYEVVLSSIPHRPDLPSLSAEERDDLAATLVDVLSRFDLLFDAPMPYMLWVHQRPTDGGDRPTAHVHIEIVGVYRSPRTMRYVAAGEVGSGAFFNPISPFDAAASLREVTDHE
jgi:UDPglucose--hexose-1-phosphate uridylyltransferase